MKLLLDTHAFLWWIDDADRLSERARLACEAPGNALFLSLASVWEMQIKVSLEKLTIQPSLSMQVAVQVERNDLQLLPIHPEHIYATASLPHHHRDPFDRLLIAQARVEGITLVTVDSQFSAYDVPVLW